MKIDMSPEAITNRLKIMEQLWELSVSLMEAEIIDEDSDTALVSEKSLNKSWNSDKENKVWQNLDKLPTV